MFRISILFGKPTNEAAFERYFKDVHVPLGAQVPGMSRIEVRKLTLLRPSDDAPAPYRMVDLFFVSQQKLDEALQSAACQEAVTDLDNFATGGVTVVAGEVEEVPIRQPVTA